MHIFSRNLLLVLIPLWISIISAAPRVRISDGILEGSILRSRKGRAINAFRGIPYARSPVGILRFQSPRPPTPWTGVRLAKRERDSCLQKIDNSPNMTTLGSEDCLYINVYTPNLPGPMEINASRYAVMVWFYGGSWVSGNSSMYGPTYLLDHDIVLVTMNYRLGPLGFLSTADRTIPGNYGLKDHVQALRWVKRNIAVFGGNPNKVTIMGESAGAISVYYLMLSPLAKGLFHQAISQSGTALNPSTFSTATMGRENAHRLGRELNCPTDSSQKLLRCLRTKDPREITAIPGTWPALDYLLIAFRPIAEPRHIGAFLTDGPNELSKRHAFANVPWLTGVNSAEGSLFADNIYGKNAMIDYAALNDHFVEIFPLLFGYTTGCSNASRTETSRRIREFYFDDRKIDISTIQNVVNMTSDGAFIFGSATSVQERVHAVSPVYYYYFAYNGDVKNVTISKNPQRNYGVGHGEELMYLFPVNQIIFPSGTMSDSDFQMVDAMTTLWTNFARFGKPVPERTSQLPVLWEPASTNSLENFIITSPTNFEMSKDMFKNVLNLWSNFPCRAGLSSLNRRRNT